MKRLAPLGLVTTLAAVLRLWRVDLAPLRYDDIDVLSRSRDVLLHGPTLTGPLTSWGIPDPPGSVYLMLPAALTPSPATMAVVWVALLNVAAVVLTYLLAERFLGWRVALAAGLLFAVNPWAVYFSRRSWAEIVPLFTVLALWSAYEVVAGGRARWAVAFFVALSVQVQIRILSLIFGPAALLTLLFWPKRWGLRWPALGIVLGALLAVPYLGWVALHWPELSAKLAEGNRGVALAPRSGAWELVFWTGAGFGLLPATSDVAPWLDPLGTFGRGLLVLVGVLLAAGLGMGVLAAVRRQAGWERALLPALWLVLPFGALVAQSSSIYLHYLVALFPAIFLVMALPIGWLLGRSRLLAGLGATVLVVVLAYQLTATALVYRVMEAYEVDEPPTEPASPVEEASPNVVKIRVLRNQQPIETEKQAIFNPGLPLDTPAAEALAQPETPTAKPLGDPWSFRPAAAEVPPVPAPAPPPVPEPAPVVEPMVEEPMQAAAASLPEPVTPQLTQNSDGSLALPAGMHDRATLDFLLAMPAPFTGLVVSIGINDFAEIQSNSGEEAAAELVASIAGLVTSLTANPGAPDHFACKVSADEFVICYNGEIGPIAQRRMSALSERLWDFQLRSMGTFSVVFSWGATEANEEALADAIDAASERMRETRQNRASMGGGGRGGRRLTA